MIAIPDAARSRGEQAFLSVCLARKNRNLSIVFVICLLCSVQVKPQDTPAPSPLDIVNRMAQAETAAVATKQHFLYRRRERSLRTKGHLWEELVIEIPDGRMHRLIAVDGKPLTENQKAEEDARIQSLAKHPDEVGRDNQGRKDDESRSNALLQMLPRMFLLTADGIENGCIRIRFKPNPAYREQSYPERVIHAAAGILLIHPGDLRLCRLDAHLEHPVEFGYGLLGKVSLGSGFFMAREQVLPGQWKTSQMHVHVDGNILLFKSVSRQEDSEHFGFQQVPYNMTVAQSASLIRATGY
jgi:hypothetical protein